MGLLFHQMTTPAKLLHQQWNEILLNNPDATILQYCHSQGAIHVRNALENYPEELRKRIKVVAIAPAAYISKDLCHSVDHYVVYNDIVPWLHVPGWLKNKDTIHVLKSHPDADWWDHSFNSPTYKDVINWHNLNYIRGEF